VGLAAAVLVGAMGLVASTAHAQPAGFWTIGGPQGNGFNTAVQALSGDGSTAVGVFSGRGFTWTREGGFVPLDPPPQLGIAVAQSVNGDGSVVVGGLSGTLNAFRRTGTGVYEDLGRPLGGQYTGSFARAVSRDGAVVAGAAQRTVSGGSSRSEAFRWSAASGTFALGFARPAHDVSIALDANADGSVLVGQSFQNSSGLGDAFVWTPQGGTEPLPALNGSLFSGASTVSADGRFVGGLSDSKAVIWDRASGSIRVIPPDGGVPQPSGVAAISDDASVAAGTTSGVSYVWREGVGTQRLTDYLLASGLQLPAGYRITQVTGVSADGRTFAGWGEYDLITGRGWVATVPAPGGLALVGGLGLIGSRRRR
jgi:uncharacterized membrane protein